MLIDCHLHQFLGSIQERVRIPHRKHVVNELKQQVIDVRPLPVGYLAYYMQA